jgi:inactivated superfamily I helicase
MLHVKVRIWHGVCDVEELIRVRCRKNQRNDRRLQEDDSIKWVGNAGEKLNALLHKLMSQKPKKRQKIASV